MDRDWSSEMAGFGALVSAMGGGGDAGNLFPQSDADDFARGVRFVPGEVTLARRRGEEVQFVTKCSPNCWYWEMPDGSRVYHYDPGVHRNIGLQNGRTEVEGEFGLFFEDGAGSCPNCGNEHTSGGTVAAEG